MAADELDSGLICPISLQVMEDPVICSDGNSYDRKQIEHWFKDHCTSPKTNKVLKDKTLITNYALRTSIQKFQKMKDQVSGRDSVLFTEKKVTATDFAKNSVSGKRKVLDNDHDKSDKIIKKGKKSEQTKSPPSNTVFIQNLNGFRVPIALSAGQPFKQTTVLQLKHMVAEIVGVAAEEQRLVYGGKLLDDSDFLSAHNIKSNCTVHLILRLRGGSIG